MLVTYKRVPYNRPTWQNVVDFEHEVDTLFGNLLAAGSGCMKAPALDYVERKDESVISIELPGVAREDVKLSIEGDMLTVKGERKSPGLPEDARWIRNERSSGEFFRTVQIPHPVKANAVSAELVNGVLRITLPKAEEARAREIGIQ